MAEVVPSCLAEMLLFTLAVTSFFGMPLILGQLSWALFQRELLLRKLPLW